MVTATALKNHKKPHQINILCIDGGGTKGIYSASLIHIIEKEYDIKLHDHFDFFMGTSSGSIIASALALDISMTKVLEMFRLTADEIIRSQYYLIGLFVESYNKKILQHRIREVFGDITLNQIKKPLAITASNIASAAGYIFRSYEDDMKHNLYRKQCYLTEVLTAACAAPTYFAPHKVGDLMFADGALWCNNPSKEALGEVAKLYDLENLSGIRLCSFGSGREPSFYSSADYNKHWGIIQWGPRLIDMILALQVNSTHKSVKHILSKEQYIRINFEYNRSFDLLDLDMVKKCELWARINFKRRRNKFHKFFLSH